MAAAADEKTWGEHARDADLIAAVTAGDIALVRFPAACKSWAERKTYLKIIK